MKFLFDLDFDQRIGRLLADEYGHEVLLGRDLSLDRCTDAEVLVRAAERGCCVVTFNHKDFKRLHNADPTHAGIVSCTRDTNWRQLAGRIDAAVRDAVIPGGGLAGKFVRVTRPATG